MMRNEEQTRALWVNHCVPWTVGGEGVTMVKYKETTCYLGMQVGPRGGIQPPNLKAKIGEWLERVGEGPLEPSQKLSYSYPCGAASNLPGGARRS